MLGYSSYQDLLELVDIPTLEHRRLDSVSYTESLTSINCRCVICTTDRQCMSTCRKCSTIEIVQESSRFSQRLHVLIMTIVCYSSVFALSMFCRFHPLFLKHAHPFAHTNSYFYSFVPHSITLWNSLNTTTVTACSRLATFRNSLNYSLSL